MVTGVGVLLDDVALKKLVTITSPASITVGCKIKLKVLALSTVIVDTCVA